MNPALATALAFALAPGVAWAADPAPAAPAAANAALDTRAAELAKLRRDVETASSELVLRKEDLRNRLDAMNAERLELEVQIRREELRQAQIHDEAAARQAEIAAGATSQGELLPALLAAIDGIEATVDAGLPFHTAERKAELDTLRDQLTRGLVRPEAGVGRLWAFTEDELRLTRENGLDRQIVSLDGGEVLADVARLGMVALYFRTDGGVVGCAAQTASGWTWRAFTSRADVLAVGTLFDKMAHGVRTGAFVLPNPEARP